MIFPASDLETCALSELALPGDFKDVLRWHDSWRSARRSVRRIPREPGPRTLSLQGTWKTTLFPHSRAMTSCRSTSAVMSSHTACSALGRI